MPKFLIHITAPATDKTKAALGFLVAKAAVEEGHEVTLFIAGDGVDLLRKEIVDDLEGLGTGRLADHLAALESNGAVIYFSGMSAKARGIEQAHMALTRAQPGMPNKLVQLAAAADVVLSY